MRFLMVATWLSMSPLASALAEVSIQFSLPGVSIGVNQPAYPQLVLVPGYPVYYDPRADSNYFFYDGLYWVYQGDSWYSSEWYDGPWALMAPQEVPLFILRVPVRFYRRPPPYFSGWRGDDPPRWGEHWGPEWARDHGGWDRWNRRQAPRPAPLPVYQRQYAGQRYPSADQQGALHARNYRYEPRDAAVKQLVRGKAAPPQAQHAQPPPQQHAQPPQAQHAPPPQAQHAPPPRQHAQPPAVQEHARPQRPAGQEKDGRRDAKGEPGQPRGEERGGEHGR